MSGFSDISGADFLDAGASLVGDVFTADQNRKSAHSAQDFSERMADTVYQRGMADLKKAGLNPIMAAKFGGDPAASGVGWQTPNIGSDFVQSQSAATAQDVNRRQADLIDAQTQVQQTIAEGNRIANNAARNQYNLDWGSPGVSLMDSPPSIEQQIDNFGIRGFQRVLLVNQYNQLVQDLRQKTANAQVAVDNQTIQDLTAKFFRDNPGMTMLSNFLDSTGVGAWVPFLGKALTDRIAPVKPPYSPRPINIFHR